MWVLREARMFKSRQRYASEQTRAVDDPPTCEEREKHLRDSPAEGQEIAEEAKNREKYPKDLAVCGVHGHP